MVTTTIFGWHGRGVPAAPAWHKLSTNPFRAEHGRYRLGSTWKLPLCMLGLLILQVWIGPLLRIVDPTAAVVDIGALSLTLLAVVALAVFVGVAHWLLGLLWPVLHQYGKHHFSNNFKSLQPWQKITFYLVIYFGLLYAFVCCLVAIF